MNNLKQFLLRLSETLARVESKLDAPPESLMTAKEAAAYIKVH